MKTKTQIKAGATFASKFAEARVSGAQGTNGSSSAGESTGSTSGGSAY